MTDSNDYRIQTMTATHLAKAVDWAAAEGWNPGLHDAECFLAADAGGFLAGFDGERMVSSISVVRYGADYAFLGFYIVDPDYRGRGLGYRLWQAGMDFLGDRTIGLDGVADQQDNYRKSGFSLAYSNIRYQGEVGEAESAPGFPGLVAAAEVDFKRLRAFDQAHFGAGRGDFLEKWLTRPGTRALAIMDGSTPVGLGAVRPCRQGYKVGPLFAPDRESAEVMLDNLLAGLTPGQPYYLDVPEVNGDAMALAADRSLVNVFGTARMYRGTPPQLPVERIYGVTSFELG